MCDLVNEGSGRLVGNPYLIGKVRFARHPPTIGENPTYRLATAGRSTFQMLASTCRAP